MAKKLRSILTAAAVVASLLLTATAGHAGERILRVQPKPGEAFRAASGRQWTFQLWELLPRLWQKALSQTTEPVEEGTSGSTSTETARSHMDPEGLSDKARSHMDPNG